MGERLTHELSDPRVRLLNNGPGQLWIRLVEYVLVIRFASLYSERSELHMKLGAERSEVRQLRPMPRALAEPPRLERAASAQRKIFFGVL